MLKGHLLNERYRIIRPIGGGGMANVYLAFDEILDREVAIKALRPEFINDPEFIERFDREAKAATSLVHPNIVSIYDVGEEDDIMYMVMEYIEGMTLKEYIKEHGALSVTEAVRIMQSLSSAIHHAHENGLIHRDIKPQNILIDKEGQVKVTDFGIAIALSATSLTQTNSILGSVHYLSPEQARGGMATKKSDIYSLGIVFYEMLTGKLPYEGQSAVAVALQHLQSETPFVKDLRPEVPQSVENIVLKSMDKNPIHRYLSLTEFETDLESALTEDRLNEPRYLSPVEPGDETKLMPVMNDYVLQDSESDTFVASSDGDTKLIEAIDLKKKPKKKKNKFKKWLLAFFILALVTSLVIATILYFKPKDVVIPDLVGKEYDEARELLEDLNVKVEKKLIHSDEINEGLIVKTDPAANRTIKEKSEVTIFVSEGAERVEVEDYTGKKFDQVKRMLEELGFIDVIAYEKASDKEVGTIITQIQPNEDSEVVPAETKVIFEVSSGPNTLVLDDLVGKTESEIKTYAQAHGLSLTLTDDYSDSVDKGKVISQNPSSGTTLKVGASISVVLSLGKEEIPRKEHTVTFTVPFKPKEDEKSQKVIIYIGDAQNNLSHKYREYVINDDEEFTINLEIEKGKKGSYKVTRDDEVIIEKSIDYKEGS